MERLFKNQNKYHFILASASPRRQDLLSRTGLVFDVIPSHVEEVYRNHLTPVAYVLENARKKAIAIAEENPLSIIVSADTIVVYNDEILEKPADKAHARSLLQNLSGNTHTVYTGFGIMHYALHKHLFDYEKTNVTFRKLSDEMIEWYLNTDEPYDKAGAYGAQGKGALLIERVDGCYFNVVGLPLSKFFFRLNEFIL